MNTIPVQVDHLIAFALILPALSITFGYLIGHAHGRAYQNGDNE